MFLSRDSPRMGPHSKQCSRIRLLGNNLARDRNPPSTWKNLCRLVYEELPRALFSMFSVATKNLRNLRVEARTAAV